MPPEHYFCKTELNGNQYNDELRGCQKGALDAIRTHFGGAAPHEAGLIVLPTGTGKSLVMLLAPYVSRAQGRCLILTPRPSITRAVLSSRELLAKHRLFEDAVMPRVRLLSHCFGIELANTQDG
eukprot:6958939-Pyramimonas_sp.AAC.1